MLNISMLQIVDAINKIMRFCFLTTARAACWRSLSYSNLLHHVNNPQSVSALLSLIRRVQKTLNDKNAIFS